ncbi:MAG: hypothetical protein H6858_05655 [Rhodospirillales bacterium]|nr:hypothetical protein [Alphaproteobacteria bacterium]MCB1840881.1 hypothetical protein [Alphaproteobacteria bacterium]MCB9977061.1 hypothetical protein [Rhodospirillales bacterium]
MKNVTNLSRKVRIIRANYLLRSKIGTGNISPETIQECQKVIEENEIDFSPLAREFLDDLAETIRKTRSREISESEAVARMAECVMQLKANAAIFHYKLVGNLAQVMLGFLESLNHIDANAVEIVEAHHKTLSAIVEKQMRGDGGKYGRQLEEELTHACERYERMNGNR